MFCFSRWHPAANLPDEEVVHISDTVYIQKVE